MQVGLMKGINYPVSKLMLGTHNWGALTDLPEARSQFRTYLEAGGFSLNISNNTKALPIAGELLAELTSREDFQVHFTAPKVFNSATLQSSINQALGSSGLDYFDVIWLHFDVYSMPISEIVYSVKRLIDQGKTRYVGLVNEEFWKNIYIYENLKPLGITPAGLMAKWNLLERELKKSEISSCSFLNISLVATETLALGVLTGKYRFTTPADSLVGRGSSQASNLLTTANASKIQALTTASEGIGISAAEAALAWLLAKDQISSVLINARNTSQLNQLLSVRKVSLPEELNLALDEVADFD